MLRNVSVTAINVSELLRENQGGESKIQIRVNEDYLQ